MTLLRDAERAQYLSHLSATSPYPLANSPLQELAPYARPQRPLRLPHLPRRRSELSFPTPEPGWSSDPLPSPGFHPYSRPLSPGSLHSPRPLHSPAPPFTHPPFTHPPFPAQPFSSPCLSSHPSLPSCARVLFSSPRSALPIEQARPPAYRAVPPTHQAALPPTHRTVPFHRRAVPPEST